MYAKKCPPLQPQNTFYKADGEDKFSLPINFELTIHRTHYTLEENTKGRH
jgi:hypothetical protein